MKRAAVYLTPNHNIVTDTGTVARVKSKPTAIGHDMVKVKLTGNRTILARKQELFKIV